MENILDFCKAAWRGVLINIIGMFMIAFGLSFAYHHTISNEFLLTIVSFVLVYFGVPLLRRDIFKLSKKDTIDLYVAYALDYMNFKHGHKIGPWDFNEDIEELKAIRDFIDNDVEEVKKLKSSETIL